MRRHSSLACLIVGLWLIIGANLTGTFLCIKSIADQMVAQREGCIINVSSGTGLSGSRNSAAYAAAKAGVFGLTKSVARELGDYNIKVNAVCAGHIAHDSGTSNRKATTDDASGTDNLLHRTSGSALEFARFVVHLSTMDNISGQTLNLDSKIRF